VFFFFFLKAFKTVDKIKAVFFDNGNKRQIFGRKKKSTKNINK